MANRNKINDNIKMRREKLNLFDGAFGKKQYGQKRHDEIKRTKRLLRENFK